MDVGLDAELGCHNIKKFARKDMDCPFFTGINKNLHSSLHKCLVGVSKCLVSVNKCLVSVSKCFVGVSKCLVGVSKCLVGVS